MRHEQEMAFLRSFVSSLISFLPNAVQYFTTILKVSSTDDMSARRLGRLGLRRIDLEKVRNINSDLSWQRNIILDIQDKKERVVLAESVLILHIHTPFLPFH